VFKLTSVLLGVVIGFSPVANGGESVNPPSSPDGSGPSSRKRAEEKSAKARPDEADTFFEDGPLPRLHIDVDPVRLRNLNNDPKTAVPARVREAAPGQADVVYEGVMVHLKGGPGSFRKVEEKPALTLVFDRDEDKSFHGLVKIHLNNSVQDGSYLCENLGAYIFRESGCPAPRVTNARVWLNGRDLGPFVLKEGFEDPFFRKYFHDKSGNLYEGSFADVDANLPVHYGLHTPAGMNPAKVRQAAESRLHVLADAMRENDIAKRRERIASVLDVDRFLTFLACESLVAHWDGYGANRNNYRIYDDPRTQRLVFLPQGMDQLFQRPDHPLYANGALMAVALTQGLDDRQRYVDRLTEIRKSVFTQEKLNARIDHVSARVLPMMREIGREAARQHEGEAAGLKQRIADRIKDVDRQIANPPRPLKFEGGVVQLASAKWETKQEGNAQVDRLGESEKVRFRITCKAPGDVGSWRTTVLLPQGRYAFEGRMKTVGVKAAAAAAAGENLAAGMRISGDKTTNRLTGDSAWQAFKYEFDVGESLREVVLVCDLKADKGQAFFDVSSLVLRKK